VLFFEFIDNQLVEQRMKFMYNFNRIQNVVINYKINYKNQ